MATNIRIDPTSLRNFKNNLTKVGQAVRSGSMRGVDNATQEVYNKALRNTPARTGFLRDSAYYDVEIDQNIIKDVVGYTANYAIARHENNTRNLRWKFLERAVNEVSPHYNDILRAYISASISSTRTVIQRRISTAGR